ncbi:hypothetical protein FOZ63_027263 [Perkinsus olseni]|uniref:Uncharacterized protein n=1 Tax=Perkinsus olseni TaxID=32597 RepID=A0A7J6TMK1_PEROL|nr:hypothetical protein FOZ63_027263 [Perkinsus olseni]
MPLSPPLFTRRGQSGILRHSSIRGASAVVVPNVALIETLLLSELASASRASFASSPSSFNNLFDEPPGDVDEYGEVGQGPAFEKTYHLGAFADKKKDKLGKSAKAERDAFWADMRSQSQSKYVKVTQLNKDRREARKKHREEQGSIEEPQATKALEEFFEEGKVAEDLKSKFGELPQVGFAPTASISTLGDPLERTEERGKPWSTLEEGHETAVGEVGQAKEVTDFVERGMLTPEKGRLESLLRGTSSVEALLTSNPECLALQHRLSKSKTSGQVLALVADELEVMDGINLATALHRIAKHSKSYQVSQVANDPRYTALTDRLGAYLSSLDGVGLMNTLWALVRLNTASPKWISELLDRCINSVDQLEPKQLGQGLYCVYRMSKHVAPTDAVKALQSALHGQVRARLDHFTDSHELVSVCTSLAKLGVRDETVFSALGSRVSDKMDDFDMEDIAAVSWAFARAKFTDRELFRKIRESLTVRTTECSVKSLVSLTWSLSKLGETGGEEDLFRYTLAPTIRS